MTTRQANLLKGFRRCLKCGKRIWADRCHRLCIRCSRRNEGVADCRGRVAHELRPWVRGLLLADEWPETSSALASPPSLAED